jgi:GRAB domain
VIAQLRQVRKNNKAEEDSLVVERDELRQRVETLTAELDRVRRQAESLHREAEDKQYLSSEYELVVTRVGELEVSLKDALKRNAELEKDVYDKDSALEVQRADLMIANQELETSRVEVSNLHKALELVQKERARDAKAAENVLLEREEEARKQALWAVEAAEAAWKQQIAELTEKLSVSEQKCQDEALFRRKAEIDLNAEKRRMQKSLEDALAQLQNKAPDDVIDRALVANLVVSYFQRRRSRDVLSLIAKVLAFDDSQLVAVGLKVPPTDIISSLFSTIASAPPAPPPEKIEVRVLQPCML